MSGEIVVVEDESCEIQCADINKASNAICYRPQGSCFMEEDIRAFDLLKLRKTRNVAGMSNLTGGDDHTRKFLESQRGHRYLTKSDPDLAYVIYVVERIKEPSVLLIRGCDLFLQADIPFEKFKTLTNLEISGCSNVTTLPANTISEMTQLQSLNLSHLPIRRLPDDFFSNLINLGILVLNGCSNLHSLPKFLPLTALLSLQLSHLPIKSLPEGFSDLEEIVHVIIKRCYKLTFLPSIHNLMNLEVLDLSHCTNLQEMEFFVRSLSRLKTIDLSYTALRGIPLNLVGFRSLTDLFLRDVDVGSNCFSNYLRVLDLSGAKNVRLVDLLKYTNDLVSLDLSRTDIESIDIISQQTELRHLILQDCGRLVELPAMRSLTNLEVLDISGCGLLDELPEDLSNLANLEEFNLSRCSGLTELREGIFDQMSCLEKLDLSKTQLMCLPSFANLINLRTLVLSQTSLNKLPDLSDLVNLHVDIVDLAPRECDETDSPKCLEGSISKPNEFHLVSTFISNSGFDKFRFELTKLNDLISNIQLKNLKSTTHMKRQLESMPADLEYILEKIDLLESSPKSTSIEMLLNCLIDFAEDEDFRLDDSTKLTQLIRMVTKLKLLVPRQPMDGLEKEKSYSLKMKKQEVVPDIDINTPELQNLLISYESLTDIQQNCLLYFALEPWLDNSSQLYIEERFYIALWYGEGLIDPEHEENADLETGSSGSKPNSIQEIGQQIFNVLQEKGFLSSRRQTDYEIKYSIRRFVVARAKEECFFDFECNEDESDRKFNTLTPHLSTGSKRACLLESQHNIPSSSAVWMKYTNTPEKLERLKNIRTLLNINDPVIDIKAEWFSKMKNLTVLVLGTFGFENEGVKDVVDVKFLEELKNMKQLRLLSLRGITAIRRLPDSVCELTNLRILNLSYCSNLEELPGGIGSLKNLTHLDLTHSHILSKFPQGLRLLSKLEVLKGFVIRYEAGGRQHINACALSHLLELENLRKLSLVANRYDFPNNEELRVFTEMRKLSNLKITWHKNYDKYNKIKIEASSHSRWKMLKCWAGPKTCQNVTKEPLDNYQFDNLEKLVLCCFPSDTAPKWVDPSGMQNLEKLYIVGGNLKTLSGTNQNTKNASWNVKTMRLSYLRNLDMDWGELRRIFSTMTRFSKYGCDNLRNYPPGDNTPMWSLEDEERGNYKTYY